MNNKEENTQLKTLPEDESIDRTRGSTHLPDYPCVTVTQPVEYLRPLTINDVPRIRSFVRSRFSSSVDSRTEKDYQRTRDDFYRMQLDDAVGYHQINRKNMIRACNSYLTNTPGSKKAVRDLCNQIPLTSTKTSVEC